ncbi:hypothetical protein F511_32608 [Dorcoceras hygrometricum]|uniref:Uncharacterized protein n=1 Tax=Dorcoceras hygrometricum TaxID=472368 RepID=A0A2Z7BZM9_9LAMI|nr:hypothetical protein F511_32608 [Dorcoceras hygrometricum]
MLVDFRGSVTDLRFPVAFCREFRSQEEADLHVLRIAVLLRDLFALTVNLQRLVKSVRCDVPEKSNAIIGVVTFGFECLPPSCDGLTGPDDHGPMISTGRLAMHGCSFVVVQASLSSFSTGARGEVDI